MDEESSKKVKERASQYLAEDEVAALNIIKSNIAKYCSRDIQNFAQELQEQIEQFSHSIRSRDNKKTAIFATENIV